MARKVFFSFHYIPDCWRVGQIRNIGAIEGNPAASDNDWEKVVRDGDPAIKNWIAGQMKGRTCAVVLVGAATAGRPWINYEIEKAWRDGLGVVGIHIHNIKDASQIQSAKGSNPFWWVSVGDKNLGSIVSCYDTTEPDSKKVYGWISDNIDSWIEAAIDVRSKN